jgi:hypothetical protein
MRGGIFILILALFWCEAIGYAQNGGLYVISAKAGYVNFVSGEVRHQRAGIWQSIRAQSSLDAGDIVQTGTDGRIELLLNPGSYLRIAGNSEVQLVNASLDDLRLKLIRGSAIVEATGASGARLQMLIETPQTELTIDRNGLYRIDVASDGKTEVAVYKGQLSVNGIKVKGGEKLASGMSKPTKFDKKAQDGFDLWSRERAELLAAANRRLSDRTIESVFWSFRNDGAWGYGRAPYFGLWVFDSALSCYTFLPFYSSWSSPYGLSYRNGFGIPWYYFRPDPPARNPVYETGPVRGHQAIAPSRQPAASGLEQRHNLQRFDREFLIRKMDIDRWFENHPADHPSDLRPHHRQPEAAPATVAPMTPSAPVEHPNVERVPHHGKMRGEIP